MVARLVIPLHHWNSLAMRLIVLLYQLLTPLHPSKLQHLQAQHLCYHTAHRKLPKAVKMNTTDASKHHMIGAIILIFILTSYQTKCPKKYLWETLHIPNSSSLVCSGEALKMAPGATAAIGKAASRETLTAEGTHTAGRVPQCLFPLTCTGWWLNQPTWKILYSQIGSFPQVRVKLKHIWNHHPVYFLLLMVQKSKS